jgi:mono/diheme cytochrome c family protein
MLKLLGIVILLVVALAAGVFVYARSTGLRARSQPGTLETVVARAVRAAAIPPDDRQRRNPVPASAEAVTHGMEHFADHCATCHANDGSGKTDFGRGLFPRPPDLRAAATQGLTDGELCYIIENGVRFTGMPAFGSTDAAGAPDTWHLVHFIRELPRLTPEQIKQMEALNPKAPDEIRRQIAEEERRNGRSRQPQPPPSKPHHH